VKVFHNLESLWGRGNGLKTQPGGEWGMCLQADEPPEREPHPSGREGGQS